MELLFFAVAVLGLLALFTVAKQLQSLVAELKELGDRLFEEELAVSMNSAPEVTLDTQELTRAIEQGIWSGLRNHK